MNQLRRQYADEQVSENEAMLKGVLVQAVILAAVISVTYVALSLMSPSGSGIDLWFLFPAVVASAVGLFFMGLTGTILRGKYTAPLMKGLQVFSICLFIGFLAMFLPSAAAGTVLFGILVIATGALCVVALLLRVGSKHLWLLARAALVMLAGIAVEIGVEQTDLSDVMRGVPLIVAVCVAGLSLLGLLYRHSHPLVRGLGNTFRSGSNLLFIAFMLSLLFVYVLKLRSSIAKDAPDLTVLAEWIVVTVVMVAVALRVFYYFRSIQEEQRFGEWRRLVQVIYRDRGETAAAQEAVDRFVGHRVKEPLLVTLTTSMVDSKVDHDEIERILAPIVRYAEPDPGFVFRWALGDIEKAGREARMKLTFIALDRTAKVLGAGYLITDNFEEMDRLLEE